MCSCHPSLITDQEFWATPSALNGACALQILPSVWKVQVLNTLETAAKLLITNTIHCYIYSQNK